MSQLFSAEEKRNRRSAEPLAARMRPQTLDEFVGQEHFLGEGKLLHRLLAADRLGSVIFHGPPGTGKTTLARILALSSRSTFRQLSAVSDGVKQLRELLTEAEQRLSASQQKTLLFIDEIHRFNKAQQDVLLPEVESGIVTLVGATTENPYFTINNALISRSRIFQFQPLTPEHIKTLLRRSATDKDRGLGKFDIRLHEDALDFLAEICDGDARQALSALEIGVLSSLGQQIPSPSGLVPSPLGRENNNVPSPAERGSNNVPSPPGGRVRVGAELVNASSPHPSPPPKGGGDKKTPPPEGEGTKNNPRSTGEGTSTIDFTRELAQESVQKKAVGYDRDGDSHYDTISALIKSIRGSDPDAAIYWLAKMLVGGDDVRFLARRLVILASEDVGNADPRALSLAVSTAHACELVGLPECQLNLAQTVIYLACAPKSNSATVAIFEARKDIEEGRLIPVPRHLRDAHYGGSEALGHVGYQYAHDFEGGIVAQEYLGVNKEYYRPTQRGYEVELTRRLEFIKERLKNSN